jgi:hypothetical protein
MTNVLFPKVQQKSTFGKSTAKSTFRKSTAKKVLLGKVQLLYKNYYFVYKRYKYIVDTNICVLLVLMLVLKI